jgi:hypothetical protein
VYLRRCRAIVSVIPLSTANSAPSTSIFTTVGVRMPGSASTASIVVNAIAIVDVASIGGETVSKAALPM